MASVSVAFTLKDTFPLVDCEVVPVTVKVSVATVCIVYIPSIPFPDVKSRLSIKPVENHITR